MNRFSTARLLAPDRRHSEASLVEGLVGLGLAVSNADLATARELGIHKSTLFRKIKALGIDLPNMNGRAHRGQRQ